MSANERQVGGDHYKTGGEEHWDRVNRLGLDYFQAQITKYVERCHKKNGVQDLQKAAHFLDKYLELLGAPTEKKDDSEYLRGCSDGYHKARELSPLDWSFPAEIRKFNEMYRLQVHTIPALYRGEEAGPRERLLWFKEILQDELNEVDDIIEKLKHTEPGGVVDDILTDVADWLGDLQVYCASEMLRWGIPWEGTLRCIMTAQWSKLGADGKPIVKDGKVVKGPNYVAPEPMIKQMITAMRWSAEPALHAACGVLNASPAGQSGRIPVEFADKNFIATHEDDVWQCEGYYGDGTQLYRHRKERTLVKSDKLSSVYQWAANRHLPITGNPTVLVNRAVEGAGWAAAATPGGVAHHPV